MVVVAFPAVPGNLEPLLADVLSVYRRADEAAISVEDGDQIPYPGLVDPPAVGGEDEKTIAAVMGLLRRVAAASERVSVLPPPPPSAVYAVLSGPELIMRWECLAGRGGNVPGFLPGFTYLASAFFLDRRLALSRSEQVRALVEAAGFGTR